MELVEWNEGRTPINAQQAEPVKVESDFDGDESVLLASG